MEEQDKIMEIETKTTRSGGGHGRWKKKTVDEGRKQHYWRESVCS
jgi:hypothetical protein